MDMNPSGLSDYGYRKVASETQPDKKPGFKFWFMLTLIMIPIWYLQVSSTIEGVRFFRDLIFHWS